MERSCRRRRPSSRAASMVTLFTSPLLLLLVVVLLLVHSAPVDAQRCAHYKQDELLDRLDARLGAFHLHACVVVDEVDAWLWLPVTDL